MPSAILPALQGFSLGAGLIVAIGAQNAFVLRQGLKREHVLPVVLVCILADGLLIALGCAGFGSLVAARPELLAAVGLGGAAFLAWYGLRALRSAMRPGTLVAGGPQPIGLGRALATVSALTLLNPHVYLDTVVLLGGIAGRFAPAERVSFAGGAVVASTVWFLGLGFGARLLAPVFARPAAWRVLDLVIAAVMLTLAALLLADTLS
ncbi:LysE/ArgO family amino acid transporter [Arenibaculum pallidiluteum]|uniref:LysE/ArgO family amino acid transporter n=1 Tax=Arenibaculum pallidiluteum TaxID=2812559 RepID=UPI001A97730D|nr:LysE/ArgO family amino acid transporter [Arenibaculum pallidiluteum]